MLVQYYIVRERLNKDGTKCCYLRVVYGFCDEQVFEFVYSEKIQYYKTEMKIDSVKSKVMRRFLSDISLEKLTLGTIM